VILCCTLLSLPDSSDARLLIAPAAQPDPVTAAGVIQAG
jgi:hypothetical protein